MKKAFIFFVVLILFIFIILILLRALGGNEPTTPIVPTPTPTRYIPPPLPTIPSDETISVNGIEIQNIYKNSKDRNREGDVDFSSSPNYSIVYLPTYKEFIITITSLPFEENRARAENEFIEKLGITQIQACALAVNISVPFSVSPELSGTRYPLSFCAR